MAGCLSLALITQSMLHLRRFTCSNLSPSEAEEREIRQAIAAYETGLTRINNEITRLQETLKGLLSDRGGTRQHILLPNWFDIFRCNSLLPHSRPSDDPLPVDQRHPVQGHKPVVHLDAGIKRTQRAIERVSHERDQVQDLLEAHKSLLSRARCVPPEIWSEIFIHCLPDEQFIQWDSSTVPLLLGQICSAWRNIALSTPQLWTSLSFRLLTDGWKSLFQMCLTLSGTLPLSLEMAWYPPVTSVNVNYFHDHILKVILPSSNRWRNLRLSLPDHSVLKLLNNPIPLLETLQLFLMTPLPTFNLTPSSAPNLRSVSTLSIYQNPHDLSIPWGQLTHFHSRFCLSVEGCLDILRECKSLQRCRLRVLSYATSSPSNPPLALPLLQSLVVTVGMNEDIGPFLDSLVLPLVSDIELTTQSTHAISHHSHVWPKLQLLSLVSRSSCPLMKLCLKGMKTDDEDLFDCVRLIPSLEDVVVLYDGRNVVSGRIRTLLLRE